LNVRVELAGQVRSYGHGFSVLVEHVGEEFPPLKWQKNWVKSLKNSKRAAVWSWRANWPESKPTMLCGLKADTPLAVTRCG
jgi:hypothetical protein